MENLMTPTTSDIANSGTPMTVTVSSLRLDPYNPRLPQSVQGSDQEQLAVILEIGFEAFAVAQSMANSGYFLGEPLLVIKNDDDPKAWTVVEGNRRLTALLGLTDSEIRSQFPDAEKWEKLANRSLISRDSEIPVIVYPDRASTTAQIGRVHVLGRLQWRPYAQARYVAARVAEGLSYSDIAEMIGITKSKVGELYRDQAIVAQAQALGLGTGEVEKAFSLLTVAMGNVKLRDHIGVPMGSQLPPGINPVPEEKALELAEVISWIFGSEDEEPKITDSRQISQLGSVVGSDVGLQSLRGGDSLEQAKQKIQASGMAPRDRLIQRLNAAKNALVSATSDFSDFIHDAQVRLVFDDIGSALESLQGMIDEIELGPTDLES
jgi:hypothetical protein